MNPPKVWSYLFPVYISSVMLHFYLFILFRKHTVYQLSMQVLMWSKSHWENKPGAFSVFSCHLAAMKYNYNVMPFISGTTNVGLHVPHSDFYSGYRGRAECKQSVKRRAGNDAGVTIHRSAGSCLRVPPAAPASPPGEKRQVHFTRALPSNSKDGLFMPEMCGLLNKWR